MGFAQALLGNPPVLILDEPTVGLDPKQIIEFRKLIRSLGKKHTVIFSSHVLSEVSATCDRVIVISNGKIAADGKTDELSQSISGKKKLSLIVDSESSDVGAELKKIPGVTKVEKVRGFSNGSVKYSVSYSKDEDIRKDVFSAMVRLDAPILEMQSGDETLEDMFLRLTQNSDDRGGKKK